MDPILIVDDEADNLQALQRLLRQDFQVTTTTSPFEALRLVQKERFHVIVSDQRMPEMAGVDLLEKVRNTRPETTRILLTGYTDIQSVIAAINRGHVYRYIAKPWDPEEFKLTVRQANEFFHLRNALQLKNEALAKSLEDLKQLDRAKARFLSLVSHELNTPLTVLSSFTDLLKQNRAQMPTELGKSVEAMDGAVKRFSEIISEILTYVRTETESRIHAAGFALHSEIEKLKPLLEKQFIQKKVRLTVQGQANAHCDAEKMRIALQKMLEDSFARAPDSSQVEVNLTTQSSWACCRISRHGDALTKEAFAPLEISGDILHHQRNLGLKLALGKLIVQANGGEILIEESPKSVASFTVRLPVQGI